MNTEKRVHAVQNIIKQRSDLDAVLITGPENIFFHTGFNGSFAFVIIDEYKVYLLTDFRYTEQANNQTVGCNIIELRQYTPEVSIIQLCQQNHIETLGFEGGHLNYRFYKQLADGFGRRNLIDMGKDLDVLRSVKDDHEIKLIRQAQAITDDAFHALCNHIKAGMSEENVAGFLENHMRKLGASGLSFPTIVASGVRSALPHGVASKKIIAKGEPVVLDFGCKYEGYCSDMTRTIFIGKPINESLIEMYNLVLETQNRALAEIKSGVVGRDIHLLAVACFQDKKMQDYFGHGLGHSLGLAIHEEPCFSIRNNDPIKRNTVITVEPGLYVPNVGGVRIEDLVVVKDKGVDNLTQSPKNMLIL